MNLKLSTILTLSLILFTGCGSATNSGSSSVGGSSTSGTVSGSYYEGAIVCFDTNGDGSCSGEVTATTDANGDFSLPGSGNYPIIAEIPVGAIKHEVLGDTGTTITNSTKTVFAIPASALSEAKSQGGKVVVSAISTKLYTYVKNHSSSDIDTAMTAVASLLGMNKKNLLKDFNSASLDSSVKARLREKATVLLNAIKGKASMSEVQTAADSFVAAMTIPDNIDAVQAQ